MTEQEQLIANNNALNNTVAYLQSRGYARYQFKEGDGISLLAGDPIHVTLDFVGPNPKNPKVINKAKAMLQFAKFGFNLTDHGGYITIQHSGTGTAVDQEILDLFSPIMKSLHGFSFVCENGKIGVMANQPITYLTPAQAQELAEALHQLGESTPST